MKKPISYAKKQKKIRQLERTIFLKTITIDWDNKKESENTLNVIYNLNDKLVSMRY